jgi:hypothetical protein
MFMALIFYRTVLKSRRRIAAKRVVAEYGEAVPLRIG